MNKKYFIILLILGMTSTPSLGNKQILKTIVETMDRRFAFYDGKENMIQLLKISGNEIKELAKFKNVSEFTQVDPILVTVQNTIWQFKNLGNSIDIVSLSQDDTLIRQKLVVDKSVSIRRTDIVSDAERHYVILFLTDNLDSNRFKGAKLIRYENGAFLLEDIDVLKGCHFCENADWGMMNRATKTFSASTGITIVWTETQVFTPSMYNFRLSQKSTRWSAPVQIGTDGFDVAQEIIEVDHKLLIAWLAVGQKESNCQKTAICYAEIEDNSGAVNQNCLCDFPDIFSLHIDRVKLFETEGNLVLFFVALDPELGEFFVSYDFKSKEYGSFIPLSETRSAMKYYPYLSRNKVTNVLIITLDKIEIHEYCNNELTKSHSAIQSIEDLYLLENSGRIVEFDRNKGQLILF